MMSTANHETLRRLAVEVGEDMIASLLVVFSDELNRYIDELSKTPSITLIRNISHSVKSSAASFGADELAEFARECESRVKLGQENWVASELPRFLTLLKATANEYKDLALSYRTFDRV